MAARGFPSPLHGFVGFSPLWLAHALITQGTSFDPQRFAAVCAGT